MIKVPSHGTVDERLERLERSVNFSPMIMGIAAVHGDGGSSGSVTSVAGGVGITNSPEPIIATGTVDLDINSLTTETTSASGDLFPFVDVSVGTAVSDQRKITRANILGTTLEGLRGYTDSGIVVQTVAGTFVGRSLVAPAAGFTISNSGGVLGNPTFALADDLAALEGMSGTGLVARTASNTYAQRTIVEGVGTFVTDGDGISGNPTIDLDINDLTAESTSASGDLFAMVDVSVGSTVAAQRKITRAEVLGTTLETLRGITLGSGIATWLATPSSANLASAITDETGGGGVLVFNSSPTIVTPTIASFTNATHNHQNAAGGGTLDHGLALTGMTDDDHSIYTLKAGRSGTNNDTILSTSTDGTLTGSSNAASALILKAASSGAGLINCVDEVRVRTGLTSITTGLGGGTATSYYASRHVFSLQLTDAFNEVTAYGATGTVDDRSANFFYLFNNAATYSRSTTGSAFSTIYVLRNAPTFQANGISITSGTCIGVQHAPTYSGTGGGTIAIAAEEGMRCGGSVATGCTITTRKGVMVEDITGAGSVTTNIGLDIAALTKATTNIGIRNAATEVATPTAQSFSSAATTISSAAKVVRLNNTSGGLLTMSNTPIIADGQDGQILILFNSSANDIALRDQGTFASSGLRLSAATVTLSQRDSIILLYSSTVGDWIQIGQTNVI